VLDLLWHRCLDPTVVMEYDRWLGSSIEGARVLVTELWLLDPYMDMISDAVSRDDGSLLPPLCLALSSTEGRGGGKCWLRDWPRGWPVIPKAPLPPGDRPKLDPGTGLMLKRPISPVSVVVFSILSKAPGDGNKAEFSLTLRRGLWRGLPWRA
jgi:hypothetical protein